MSTSFAKAEMLIRKPVEEVFKAFVDPEITTRFWFTSSSGRLETGKEVEWTWEMYGHTETVSVLDVTDNKTILIEWGTTADRNSVEWTFIPLTSDTTFVSIVNDGLKGNEQERIALVRDSTEGFTLVLAGLKALMEYDIELGLVGDRFPKGLNTAK